MAFEKLCATKMQKKLLGRAQSLLKDVDQDNLIETYTKNNLTALSDYSHNYLLAPMRKYT